ncbi:glucosaminidase domain-containing protein [Pedobacter sp.]|uniref:glucosaminidase domain-containing protein n=1 Tax=Pedobacter sp. TaxID=1411316 RepID=UPI003D7FB5F5
MIKKLMFIWIALLFTATASHAQTTLQYINNNAAYAQQLMRENRIPASIILAVAIHESAAGTSKIAKYLNNHFGVKGQNSSKEIKSAYKGYSSVEDSYDHFIDVLQNKSAFSRLFDKYDEDDYVDWAKGIQRGGYAHSKLWSTKVIALIKKYELFKYDTKHGQYLNAVLPLSKLK